MDWLHHLWFVYFWPSLQGNGPEDLFHLTLLGAAGYLASRIGKKIVSEWREHKAKVDAEHVELHAKLDAGHKMLHHIITSVPEIDNCIPGLPEKYQPPQ